MFRGLTKENIVLQQLGGEISISREENAWLEISLRNKILFCNTFGSAKKTKDWFHEKRTHLEVSDTNKTLVSFLALFLAEAELLQCSTHPHYCGRFVFLTTLTCPFRLWLVSNYSTFHSGFNSNCVIWSPPPEKVHAQVNAWLPSQARPFVPCLSFDRKNKGVFSVSRIFWPSVAPSLSLFKVFSVSWSFLVFGCVFKFLFSVWVFVFLFYPTEMCDDIIKNPCWENEFRDVERQWGTAYGRARLRAEIYEVCFTIFYKKNQNSEILFLLGEIVKEHSS